MKLASIETIHSFTIHPNSEILVKAKVLGWNVVVKKGDFQEGESVIFIFPDVLVDKTNPQFSFMEQRKWKVWQAKFRGEPSAGLVMPISLLKDYISDPIDDYKTQIGLDVGAVIKCEKYEKPLDITINGDTKGSYPGFLARKTDEDNLRSNPRVIEEFKGKTCIITQKADGSSFSAFYVNTEEEDKKFKVCSRNLEIKEGENAFWHVANKYNLREKLTNLNKNIAIQGEVVGPKMNGNRLGLSVLDLYVFNIKDLDTGVYYNYNQIVEFCKEFNLTPVKFVSEFVWGEDVTIDKLQEIADSQVYPNGAKGEGIVIRPIENVWSNVLDKELSVKLINQNYKD
jgi:RNA ligase (TIGR02306 family)